MTLEVDGLTVRFGGLVAVEGVSLAAPPGRLTALIGPNGAGKTTTFNACCGLVKPAAGHVRLHGTDITTLAPHQRAQRGLGRTFQRMELFDSLRVAENVAMGREAGQAGWLPWSQIAARRSEREVVHAATREAMALCGIESLAHRRPAELSTGQRRLVELARAVAGEFSVLLLDEPSSGLDRAETRAFSDILRSLVERGTAILVVEHDMSLVMSVSDYIYVLDFGRPIFAGSPDEVAASHVVRAAYLGAADVGLAV